MAYQKKYTDLEKAPKYCSKCSKKLIQMKYSLGYDGDTGKELFGTRLYCSAFKIFTWHYDCSFDDNGDEIIDYDYM